MLTLRLFLISTAAAAVLALPAAASAQTLDNLTQDTTFPAYQSTVKQSYPATGPNAGKPTGFGNFARATVQVVYDYDTDSYIVRDTGNRNATTTFGPGQITSSDSSYTYYSRVVGGTMHTLKLLNPGATNPTIALSYASYGHWRTVTPGGGNFGNTAQSDTYFVYGFKTAKADMPTMGSASYDTLFDGTYATAEKNYDVDGTGTLTANFASSTLSFTSTLTGTPATGRRSPSAASTAAARSRRRIRASPPAATTALLRSTWRGISSAPMPKRWDRCSRSRARAPGPKPAMAPGRWSAG